MYTAIELAKKLHEDNKEKVFLGKKLDPANVVIYCNRPDLIRIPKESGWYFSSGSYINKNTKETINIFPKFYLEEEQ